MNEEARLLFHFAQVVGFMRDLQKVESRNPTPGGSPTLTKLEQEVDSLVTLHLLPPIPNAPYIAQDGPK